MLSLFAFSDPGDLVHFESSPGVFARLTSDVLTTARSSYMCMESVCNRVFELSQFNLWGGVLVELQTLKTIP